MRSRPKGPFQLRNVDDSGRAELISGDHSFVESIKVVVLEVIIDGRIETHRYEVATGSSDTIPRAYQVVLGKHCIRQVAVLPFGQCDNIWTTVQPTPSLSESPPSLPSRPG